ncbi:MAG: tetratricopeptide repeat protein [Dysgonamonadaceae bacterium]|jgi:tetratricopeptide (TPR) repeat protein|nr:tetratricopeptide repeat protein [Dysgonamonadaceae bacterium]
MKPLFSLLFLLLSLSVSAQQQKGINNTYTQTEVDLKLQLQQKEVEGLQKDFKVLQQQIQDNIDNQEKCIQSMDKRIDRTLTVIAIIVALIAAILALIGIISSYWVKLKIKEVKATSEEVTQMKENIEDMEREARIFFEEAKQEIHTILEDARNKNQEFNEIMEFAKSVVPTEAPKGEIKKVEEQIKKTEKMKAKDEYTFDDWFLKAFDAQAKKELEKACLYYEKAIELGAADINLATAYYNWGIALDDLGKINGEEKLFKQSIEKYKKAIGLKPDYATAYCNWGTVLVRLGKMKSDEKLLEQSIEKCKKAIELKPDYAMVYYNWGIALTGLGKIKKDEKLFEQSIEKYKIATGLEADYDDAYCNWGYVLIELGKMKEDIFSYKEEIKYVLLKAEDIKEGAGSYNLACLHSLLEDKNKALEWLEKDLQNNKRPKKEIEKDDDFANIKGTSEFKNLLDKYFPDGK